LRGHETGAARATPDVRGAPVRMRGLDRSRLVTRERGVDELSEAGAKRAMDETRPEHVFAGYECGRTERGGDAARLPAR